MHRFNVLAGHTLASNNGELFKNASSNDYIMHTKFGDQKILISPMTNGGESILTVTKDGIDVTGDSYFRDRLVVNGNARVVNDTFLDASLTVEANAHIKGTLRIGGNNRIIMYWNDDITIVDPNDGTGSHWVRNASDSDFGSLKGNFVSGCSRDYKKNIKVVEHDDLARMHNEAISTNIFQYHYKQEDDSDIKRIGVILEEAPRYLGETRDAKALNHIAYIAMLHASTKVLDKKCKEQEECIDALKAKVEQLEAIVYQLVEKCGLSDA